VRRRKKKKKKTTTKTTNKNRPTRTKQRTQNEHPKKEIKHGRRKNQTTHAFSQKFLFIRERRNEGRERRNFDQKKEEEEEEERRRRKKKGKKNARQKMFGWLCFDFCFRTTTFKVVRLLLTHFVRF
jgi:hypothetical protein